MAETAALLDTPPRERCFIPPPFVIAELAADLDGAEQARQEYARFAASIAVTAAGVEKPKDKPERSLLQVLRTPERSLDDDAFIDTNVATKVAEIFSKSGSILTVKAHMNEHGEIEQFGQATPERQRMTLEWYPDQSPALLANTHAEGRNAFTIEHLHRNNKLQGKRVMEVSMVLDTAERQELVDYDYFLDTMTAIIRLTDISPEGEVTITSGLVGGVDEDIVPAYHPDETQADEDARLDTTLSMRFDVDVVRELYRQFGVEGVEHMSTTELLGTMLIIPDTLDVIDIIMCYDQIAGATLEKPVFFGLTGLASEYYSGQPFTRSDYMKHFARIKARQDSFQPTAQAVAAELKRRSHEPRTPIEAVELLDDIAKRHTLRHAAVVDVSIDARMIFGRQAAELVQEARIAAEWGDSTKLEQKLEAAAVVAKPTGCPTGGKQDQARLAATKTDKKSNDAKGKYGDKKGNDNGNKKEKKKPYAKREWMRCVTCPLCTNKPVDATIDYYPEERIKRITCCKCEQHKDYGY